MGADYAISKHDDFCLWLANHPKLRTRVIPTYSLKLNQVETWFGINTGSVIRLGPFNCVKQLVAKMDV
jgi:hypothetical protein